MHNTIPQISAINACVKHSEWTKPFDLYSGHKTIAEPTSYKMTELKCPNRDAWIQRAVDDIKAYETIDFCQKVPEITLYAFQNALVLPEGVIIIDDMAVAETIKPLPHKSRINLLALFNKMPWDAEYISSCDEDTPVLIIEQPGINNYGHWIIEMFPKIIPLVDHIVSNKLRIALSAPSSLSIKNIILQTIECLGVNKDAVLWLPNKPVRFHKTLYMSPISKHQHNPGHISPWCISEIERNTSSIVGGKKRKLFVSRQGANSRILLNEDAVFAALEPFGYEKILTSKIPFIDQIKLFKGATHVVGVFGAALTNVVFCQAGTKFLNICPNQFIDHFYWNIASLKNISYWHFNGSVQGEGQLTVVDFKVDIEEFKSFFSVFSD